MTSMGEGSSNQGDVHEGLNFAAIHKLPFVFVVENNGYAISVPAAMQVSVADVADRASGYGIPGVVVDGEDVLACYAAARDAVARARAGDGPTLIEAKVTRLTAHSSDDQQTKYRSEEDLAAGRERDALPLFRAQLRDGRASSPTRSRRGWPPTSRPPSTTRPTTPRPSPTRPSRARCATSTPRTSTDADPDVHRGHPRDARRRDAPR